MSRHPLDILIRCWASLGAGFDAGPIDAARAEIDLERLLLDTARHATDDARLFIMSATWLHRYGDLVAKHRLKRLIRDELGSAEDAEHRAGLGLLLDIAQHGSHPLEFQTVIKHLQPAPDPHPLFASARSNAKLADLANRKASPISRRWNLWCDAFDFKDDALRPAAWMMARHPGLRTRADFRGDLRASILASLQHDAGAGESEMTLARLAGGSRAQVRLALANLAMTGRVSATLTAGSRRRRLRLDCTA
jgi:hypothetical protein